MTSEEVTYVFVGRVLPERSNVNIERISRTASLASGTQIRFQSSVESGQLSVVVTLVGADGPDLFTLKNLVEDVMRAQTDALGYALGAGYDVEVTAGGRVGDALTTLGVAVPELWDARDARPLPVTTAIQLALRHVSLRRAFADFREAIRSPIDTGFFCYRTAETVMQHFRDRDTKRAGWDRMKDVLNIEEAALRWLQVQADAPRHGQVAPLPAKDQVRALTLVQQLLDRFALFLADAIGARGKFVEPIRLPDGKGDDSETH